MTDLYVDDDYGQPPKPGELQRFGAEMRRFASELERRVHDSASGAVEDARLLVRRAQHRINRNLGTAALAALGAGLALGLLAAAVAAYRRRGAE